jgi:AraC family transcriptional regulator, regulatory protein of adaptative response / methylated-DNA-[protein]-cysteine methyltransferase
MLFDLPSHGTLYQALLERDERYDGQVYVCVATTGIFCRLTCPARKPKIENCTFYATIGECIENGFRACKRCHPLQASAMSDPAIKALLTLLDKRPDFRWSEAHIAELGFDLSTVRRSFKRQFGMTFLEMARHKRIKEGFESLSQGGKVITAQHQASFESPSAFRAAFTRLLGGTPSSFSKNPLLLASWILTPLGDMIAVCSQTQLHLLEFIDRKALSNELKKLQFSTKTGIGVGRTKITEQLEDELAAFFGGRKATFETPLALQGSTFTLQVWEELRLIPAGHTRSYSEIARRIGKSSASRAVARANGANQIALLVPCHRVIGADGSLTGYGGGRWRKQRLIEIELQFKRPNQEVRFYVSG